MITQVRPSGYNNPKISTFAGRSIDTKPINVENGSKFTEIDTGRIYVFDKTNKTWIEKTGTGRSSVNIEPITIVENGVTTAPTGTAYSPVTVNVPSVLEPYVKETYNTNFQLISAEIVGSMGEKIRAGLFYNCSALTTVSWTEPKNVIEQRAFESCTSIASLDFSNDYIQYIKDYAFFGCSGLKKITFRPNLVEEIGNNAFENCSSLQTISVGSNNSLIMRTNCFKSCTSLNAAYLSSGFLPLSFISTDAFEGCPNLINIYVSWAENAVKNAPWGATNATIHYNYTGD